MESARRKCLEIILQNTLVKLYQKGLSEEYKQVIKELNLLWVMFEFSLF